MSLKAICCNHVKISCYNVMVICFQHQASVHKQQRSTVQHFKVHDRWPSSDGAFHLKFSVSLLHSPHSTRSVHHLLPPSVNRPGEEGKGERRISRWCPPDQLQPCIINGHASLMASTVHRWSATIPSPFTPRGLELETHIHPGLCSPLQLHVCSSCDCLQATRLV